MNRLITIPISHYCEKARWALQRAEIPYVEEPHLQGFHYPHALLSARTHTVPILVTAEGVLKDSSDILNWANERMSENKRIYPSDQKTRKEVEAFVKFLDDVFGPAGRLWMYTYMFARLPLILDYSKLHNVPDYEIKLMPLLFPLLKPFARRRLRWTTTSRNDSKRRVDDVFSQVANGLAARGPFLFGEIFSAADLTFAALCAPALLPEKYGVALPKLAELPTEMAQQVELWRKHIAGKYALQIYERFR